jgi:hypothetical protein
MKKIFFAAVFVAFAFVSCAKDDDDQNGTTLAAKGQSVEVCQGERRDALLEGVDTTIA